MSSAPISPPRVTSYEFDYLPAYLANGVIGLRVPHLPLQRKVVVASGLAAMDPETRVEEVGHAPDPIAGDIAVNGHRLSDHIDAASFVDQHYDFEHGELTTRFEFRFAGVIARAEVLTFCSRTQPGLIAQEVAVTVDAACQLSLHAVVDPSGIAGRWAERTPSVPATDDSHVDGSMRWRMLGDLASCGVAYATTFDGGSPHRSIDEWKEQAPLRTTYTVAAHPGGRYRLRQIASVIPSAVHSQPDRQATRLTAAGARTGFDELREDNRRVWKELWRARPVLLGADRKWQALVDAAFFYLHSSTHASSLASTHIFGLAQWKNYHYYRGHVMWDVEAFAIAPLLLSEPHAARAILDFRTRSLEAARGNARMNGYRGLQFPWEAGPGFGEEATPGDGDAAAFEHHVSMDVAHAFAQFAWATGDDQFCREQAWPVLHGVAEWIESRVVKTARGYEIRRALGIAERKEPSDNPAYVNMTAAVVLRDAMATASSLGRTHPDSWRAIADGLVPPCNDAGVVIDHDGWSPDEEKAGTPAALAGIFPFGYELPAEQEAATIRHWLDLADEYIGSPMLAAFYGAWACRIGARDEATRLFDEGYARYTVERFHNIHELRHDRFPETPVAGPFLANYAAFLTAVVYGGLGLHVGPGDPSTWCERPVTTPDAWDGVEIERVWMRGEPYALSGRQGDRRATLERAS